MTRLLILADTQIGVGTVTLADQRAVLDQIVQVAIEEGVDVVVHGGDVFEGPVVTPEEIRMFLDATEPLHGADIPILVLKGNGRHDSAVRPVHALDVLREIPGFIVSDRPDAYLLAGAAICTLPWVHPGQLIAKMNGSIDHDRINEAVSELLVTIATDVHAAAPAEVPTILVAHWAIDTAKLPSGLSVNDLREPVLPWAELDAIGYDMIVGAHIHEGQVLNDPELDRTPGFVVGSPQQLNFGEHGDKGCWLVDVTDQVTWTFVPIESRQFVTIDFDHDDPVGQFMLSDSFGWDLPAGAIVRVKMRLDEQTFQELDQAAVRNALLDAGASHVRLDLDVQREARRRIEINEQISPVQAMALYCDAAGIEDPLRTALIQTMKLWSEE